VNESGDGVDGAYVNSTRGEDDDGAPRHSLRFAAASRSPSRSASMEAVVDNNLIVARLIQ